MKNYFKVLLMAPTATFSLVTKAYRKQALLWHPDKNPNNREEATNKFQEITEAWEHLNSAEKLGRYYDEFQLRKSEFPELQDDYDYAEKEYPYYIVQPEKAPPELKRKMQEDARNGDINEVINNMHMGEQTRPIYLVLAMGIHPSHFDYDIMELDRFKARLCAYFRSKELLSITTGEELIELKDSDAVDSFPKLRERCKIAELFFRNPTLEFRKELGDMISNPYNNDLFLPFFVWLAMNNIVDIINTDVFASIFIACEKPIMKALQVSAIFNAADFILEFLLFLKPETTRILMSLTIATRNQALLEKIVGTLEDAYKFSLTNVENPTLERGDKKYGTIGDDEPMFWAIRSDQQVSLDYLLKHKVDPNGYIDNFSGGGYLHLAARMGSIEASQSLITSGATVDLQDCLGDTPLLELLRYEKDPIKRDRIGCLLVNNGASLAIENKDRKRALDFVDDNDELKPKLIQAAEQRLLQNQQKATGSDSRNMLSVSVVSQSPQGLFKAQSNKRPKSSENPTPAHIPAQNNP
jgi:hypothetical protein